MERVGGARAVRCHPRRSGGGEDSRRPRRAAQSRGAHGGPCGAAFGNADARAGETRMWLLPLLGDVCQPTRRASYKILETCCDAVLRGPVAALIHPLPLFSCPVRRSMGFMFCQPRSIDWPLALFALFGHHFQPRPFRWTVSRTAGLSPRATPRRVSCLSSTSRLSAHDRSPGGLPTIRDLPRGCGSSRSVGARGSLAVDDHFWFGCRRPLQGLACFEIMVCHPGRRSGEGEWSVSERGGGGMMKSRSAWFIYCTNVVFQDLQPHHRPIPAVLLRCSLDAVRSSPARTDTVAVQAASVLAWTEHRQYFVSCVFRFVSPAYCGWFSRLGTTFATGWGHEGLFSRVRSGRRVGGGREHAHYKCALVRPRDFLGLCISVTCPR